MARIDANYGSVTQRALQQPRAKQPGKSHQSEEDYQADWDKAIKESNRIRYDPNNYLSEEENGMGNLDNSKLSEVEKDQIRTALSKGKNVKGSQRILDKSGSSQTEDGIEEMKNPRLSKKEQVEVRKALSNTDKKNVGKSQKRIQRKLDNNKKPLPKVFSGFSNTISDQDLSKLSAMVASEFSKILKTFIPFDNDSDNIADFKAIAGRDYEHKKLKDQEKFLSEFSKIESFLMASPDDCSAFDQYDQPTSMEELLDIMKMVEKHLKTSVKMMTSSELYFYKRNKMKKEELLKQAEKETDNERKEELLKQASEIKTERTKNRLNLIEENVENLIKCVRDKPIAILRGGKINKQTNYRLNAFSKQFGLSDSEKIQNFIQNQKSSSNIFGLEQSKALVETLIPEEASHSEDVCKNVTEKLGVKNKVLKKLILDIIKRTEPLYGSSRLKDDEKEINHVLDGRINNLVKASKNHLKFIQEQKNSLSDSSMIKAKRLENYYRKSKQNSVKKDEINSSAISSENQKTVAISEKDQSLNNIQSATVNKGKTRITMTPNGLDVFDHQDTSHRGRQFNRENQAATAA